MITWEYGVVGFVDILGFSNLVENDARKLIPENLQRIMLGLLEAKQGGDEESINILSFSDTIILSCELNGNKALNLLKKAAQIQKTLLKQKILTRGGIAFGKHFQNTNTLFSEALIKAYKIETIRAKFPRIVIDKDLIDWVVNDEDTTHEQKIEIASIMLADKDAEFFLDYLSQSSIPDSLNFLNGLMPNKITASVLEKYQWLNTYHNYKCQNTPTLSCDSFSDGFSTISFKN